MTDYVIRWGDCPYCALEWHTCPGLLPDHRSHARELLTPPDDEDPSARESAKQAEGSCSVIASSAGALVPSCGIQALSVYQHGAEKRVTDDDELPQDDPAGEVAYR
jgi:hypothetical protein